MGLPATAVWSESVYLGDIQATTDDTRGFPVFNNNSGLDIVITEAEVASYKGSDTASYFTVTLKDQDQNTISTLAYSAASAYRTTMTAMGTCSATHGVIPDGEFVYAQFDQTGNGDNLDDFSIHFSWKFQTPED